MVHTEHSGHIVRPCLQDTTYLGVPVIDRHLQQPSRLGGEGLFLGCTLLA